MHDRVSRSLVAPVLAGLAVLAGAGCAVPQYRISVTPSLRPVDSSRSMVVFSQIQGQACGRDAVLGAIRDMKRLSAVDGYLEVVVEETGAGDERCAKVTAYPFRYGESTETPVVRAAPESLEPLVVPGGKPMCGMHGHGGHEQGGGEGQGHEHPAGKPPAALIDCNLECGEVAALVEPAAIKQALVKDRCVQRCKAAEPGFAVCIAGAATAAAAAQCLQPAGAAAPSGEER